MTKARLAFYKRYPRDFIEGTIGMPFEVKTTYAFILDLIYLQDGYLPDDPRYIAGLLGVSVRKWNSLRLALIEGEKIVVSGEFLTNYRALSELESLVKHSDKQREKRLGWRKNKDLQKPQFDQPEPEPDKESPLPPVGGQECGGLPLEDPPQPDPPTPPKNPYTQEFEEWWSLYPRKVGKGDAFRAFKRAKKKVGVEKVFEGLRVHGPAIQKRIDQGDGKYVPHAARWLNDARYDDPPPKAQSERREPQPGDRIRRKSDGRPLEYVAGIGWTEVHE